MIKLTTLVAAALLGASVPALAQEQLAAAPAEFVTKAGSIGMAEVAMGQLGAQKAQSAQVKEFAQHIIQDHSRNNLQLQQAAAAAGQTLPAAPTDEEREALARLQSMPESQFDQAFMQQMVQDHKKAVQLYQAQAQAGRDPQLQAYAQATLPALQQHLQMAQSLAGSR